MEIECAPDSAKMYKAVKFIKQGKREKLIISDKNGIVLCDDKVIVENIKECFETIRERITSLHLKWIQR